MDLHDILRTAETVAIVGCSNDPYRASNHAVHALVGAGYSVIPVNPKYDRVNDIRCFADFDLVPDDHAIDIVNVFRNPEHTFTVVEAAIARAGRTGRKPVIWTQPGVSSSEAELAAIRAGFLYIQNRCIMTELAMMK